MEKRIDQQNGDITQESYKGPGAFVTGTGEGAVAHYGFAFGGLLVGGLVTYIFHNKAGELVAKWRQSANELVNNTHTGGVGSSKRFFGKCATFVFGHGEGTYNDIRSTLDKVKPEHREAVEKMIANKEHGFGHALLSHTFGLVPSIGRRLKTISERTTNAVAVGGIFGFAGFVLSPVYFMFSGAKHANDGRRQFDQAKDEIILTRAERDSLLQKYAEVKTELDTLKATQSEAKLNIAADAPPPVDAVRENSTASLARIEHGDSPVSISKPRIEGPPIQKPTIEGPAPESPIPKNQWWDGKEQGANHAERLAARDEQAAHETAR